MFVIIYFVTLAYFAIAAISDRVTTVPDTWAEWERIAVLTLLAVLAYWWGGVVSRANIRTYVVRLLREGVTSKEE